jgi:hypothetical protein
MKKTEENRFPHSSALFQFCKEALSLKSQKVMDQEVGNLLGYDPADCSHWKKGKKNIKSLTSLKTLADGFQMDEKTLMDLITGKISKDEALLEYRGIAFEPDQKIQNLALQIHQRVEMGETPVPMDIICSLFPSFKPTLPQDLHPYRRLATGKELFLFLAENALMGPLDGTKGDLFASYLLVPEELLLQKIKELPPSPDVILELAEIFCVPKSLIAQRVQDFFRTGLS